MKTKNTSRSASGISKHVCLKLLQIVSREVKYSLHKLVLSDSQEYMLVLILLLMMTVTSGCTFVRYDDRSVPDTYMLVS